MRVPARPRIRMVVTLWVLAMAMAIAGCGGGNAAPSSALALVGNLAPALSGPSLTGDGSLDLTSMSGKPTVVVFWLNTCPHCQAFVPELQRAWPAVANKANILFAGMPHPDGTVKTPAGYESPEAFVATTGLTLPTLKADWDTATASWKFDTVPAVYVLDASGVVRKAMVAPETKDVIEAVASL